ncbi:hypothetical protein B0H12DRAFT_1127913 [Mycena haematopus]|nr:hypothetical protein B0H12DRAFT_1127913 [Mycena haematopus]
MQSRDLMLVYTGDRLFVLRTPHLVQFAVPKNAWILLDSNAHFASPPQEVAESNIFIVQAVSSRAGRTAWAAKIRGPYQFCVMRPWTLEELFAASSLQPQVCSGREMHAFFTKFGGSARHVYEDSHDLPGFEALVNASAESLDRKTIHRAMWHISPTPALDETVGHMLITALPISNADRRNFRLSSPTAYLEGKLLARLNGAHIHLARRELYVLTAGVPLPGCKATARHLLDRHHHEFIALGGQWRLRQFAKVPAPSRSISKTYMWRATDEAGWVLEANGKMSVFREAVARCATEFEGLTAVDFAPASGVTQCQLKTDCYYRPSPSGAIDSFYMDRTGHGFTFQVQSEGDSSKPHTVRDGGQEWLEGRGVSTFTYVLVSGPEMGVPTILVPRAEEAKFDYFFWLVLEYPDLKRLL